MEARVPESTQRYLDTIADDVRGLLGDGIELVDLRLERIARPRGVELRASYRLGAAAGESVGRGTTAIQAHARLRAALVEDRIGITLAALTRGVAARP